MNWAPSDRKIFRRISAPLAFCVPAVAPVEVEINRLNLVCRR